MFKIIFASLLFISVSITGEIVKSIGIGDAKSLASYFNNTVDLIIKSEEGTYSKIQAEQIVKKFFTTHPVVKYTMVHTGKAKDGSSFEIGKLQTKAGIYRTYFLLKTEGNSQKIHQFRIEDDNE